jgi:CPA2 family monovalent cation:H+ antiporter-2
MALAWWQGWSVGAGVVFGLALSVASTVVLLRALQERRLLETRQGRIAVGWLIVEDLAMVLTLVLLPALAGLLGGRAGAPPELGDLAITLGLTLGKVAAFVALMLLVGRRVIPWVLHYVAHTGSRELFRLAVLAIALGVAYGSANLFGVSFALGAFFAGMVLAESELSHRAAEESLPLRDAFAVLFFVSVGMLFDPGILVREPWPVLWTLLIILVGKSVAALLIVRAFGHPLSTALTISASLAQIGEFSFILAVLGLDLGLLPPAARDLVLAGAILSIIINPLFFVALDRLRPRFAAPTGADPQIAADEPVTATALEKHAVVIGFGRVGRLVAEGLREAGRPVLVVETQSTLVEAARRDGFEAILGNAAQPDVLAGTRPDVARWFLVAIPDPFEAGQIVEQARAANTSLEIVARAHSDIAVDHLRDHGASLIIMGEREIAQGMLAHALGMPAAPV